MKVTYHISDNCLNEITIGFIADTGITSTLKMYKIASTQFVLANYKYEYNGKIMNSIEFIKNHKNLIDGVMEAIDYN